MAAKPRKIKPETSSKEVTSVADTTQFPIVGIGASAGGLEAFEQFLGNVPENSGMAYVIIQHLDPTQKGMLPELLQRISKMQVFQVTDRMVVKPNCIYVIPPNKSMSILKGVLHLFEPFEMRGLRLPIDFFLRSLADDQQERSIGIILSGMGSDGCLGLRAIKEKKGLVLIQDPATAKFDSMPRHAIDSVQADIVAPAGDLPSKLMALTKYIPVVGAEHDPEFKDQSAIEKIIILLRVHTGNDFSLYKKNTLYRRVERRMGVHKLDKIISYVHLLQENPKEIDILFKELMIGVTNFFRDIPVWKKLQETIIPAMLGNKKTGSIFRAWIPGCSTGEEAYSLAIVFKEALEISNLHKGFSLQIFATDLDNEAIQTARKGVFPVNIAADVSPERLSRFFITTDEGFRISTELREMVVFAQHNIIMQPPFTKIDLVSCRNLLIYLDAVLQNKILGMFYNSLNPDGILLLGSSETLGKQGHLFTTLDGKLKIYKPSVTHQTPKIFDFPSSFARDRTLFEKQLLVKSPVNIQTLADQLLLEHFSPPAVLVNDQGDIIYISGHTGKYLEPAVGKANLNIFAMLREGLHDEIPYAFQKVIKTKKSEVLRNIIVGTNGGIQTLNVTIQWIDKPESLKGMVMIIFTDVPGITGVKTGVKKGRKTLSTLRQLELEEELQHAFKEKQSILEEMQTSQEELKSTNEELQSANEELQSTNEELTSSKEEMQSLNEELQTVNAELQSKVDEFSRVNNDMKNLLNSTDIATLFLDKDLNIRRFTNQATKIFKLINSDIGRPFTDQVSDLIYPGLTADALEVLRTLIFIEKQIPTKDSRWFTVRIMPYRTHDDRIDGLVITFINISDHKQLELDLHEKVQEHRLLVDSSSEAIIKLSTDWKILEFNHEAGIFFGKKSKDVLNKNFMHLFIPETDQKKTEKEMNKLLSQGADGKFKMQLMEAGGKMAMIEWSVNVLVSEGKKATGIILIHKK